MIFFKFHLVYFLGLSIDPIAHLKCIRLGSSRSRHLPFKMHQVGYVRSSLLINACWVSSNTHSFFVFFVKTIFFSYFLEFSVADQFF